MPRTEQQFEKIRKDKRETIMQVALKLFSTETYHATTVSKIASAAGISKGLMYNYFPSKEALLLEILEEATLCVFGDLDQNHDGKLSDDEFEHYVRQSFITLQNNKEYFKLYYSLVLQKDVQKAYEENMKDLSKKIMLLMYDYFNRNFEDPQTELMMFSSTLKGLNMIILYSDDQTFVNEQLIEKLIQKILKQYKKP